MLLTAVAGEEEDVRVVPRSADASLLLPSVLRVNVTTPVIHLAPDEHAVPSDQLLKIVLY